MFVEMSRFKVDDALVGSFACYVVYLACRMWMRGVIHNAEDGHPRLHIFIHNSGMLLQFTQEK